MHIFQLLTEWAFFFVGLPPTILGLFLLSDEAKAFAASRVCFWIAAIWVWGKVMWWGIYSPDKFHSRAIAVFLACGIVGVGLVEALRLVASRKAHHSSEVSSEDTTKKTIHLPTSATVDTNESPKPKLKNAPPPRATTLNEQKALLFKLTQLYVTSHDGVSAEILSGLELPPDDWLNQQLQRYGKNWRVKKGKIVDLPAETPNISAPGGINISGGTVINPTVNNFAPPPANAYRRPTEDDRGTPKIALSI